MPSEDADRLISTDEQESEFKHALAGLDELQHASCRADVARLERELAKSREWAKTGWDHVVRLERELGEAREAIRRYQYWEQDVAGCAACDHAKFRICKDHSDIGRIAAANLKAAALPQEPGDAG